MTANVIQAAYNPDLFKTRSTSRPLSNKEIMQRASAICANTPSPKSLPCTGQIFIGMFFDGTGNNENNDFIKIQSNPSEQKHSNVVRLYHAYPDRVTKGTTKYYRYYIPGVGTPFPEIKDSGGALGTGASWNGEPRLIWGMTCIFNAVSNYVTEKDLIPEAQAGEIANATGGLMSLAMQREHVFRSYWSGKLKKVVEGRRKDKPKPEQINLSVYGFSRGAAEARAFVNWLYAICDEKDGGYLFSGIPLRIQFLGIFDTVASVGIAGAFTAGPLGSEGHQSWAKDNMQIHKGVESCLHIVAAHEVRATFPMDSVRIEGAYPPNVKEYVYPGSHSDVGGGYHPKAQGKTDALARIPGFEMYCAAMAAGVPFINFKELKSDVAQALVPSQAAVDIFSAYCSKAGVIPGPVEEMMRQHMAHYFNYRYQARNDPVNNKAATSYIGRDFFKKAKPDQEFLRDTQQHFIAILAAVSEILDQIMKDESSYDDFIAQPFQSQGSSVAKALKGGVVGMRVNVLRDASDNGDRNKLANKVHEKIAAWRRWLADHLSPDLVDADAPERNVLNVIEKLTDNPLADDVVHFFDNWVHDSSAGLAQQHVNEFLLNGIGIAKFRRVYFGNRGDAMLREAAEKLNKERAQIAKQKRAQMKQ
jgi:uncharacterized protein (DUF2235 family)